MKKGFTLIELLIVVAIIGILAAIAVPNFLNAQVRAKVARVEADFKTMATALEMYKIDTSKYPPFVDPSGSNINPVNRRLVPLTTPIAYLSSIPQDPFLERRYGERVVASQNAAYVTYDYVDAWTIIHNAGATMVGASLRCSEWQISSAGPDYDAETYGTAPTWNATNGLTSRGDMIILGPRTSFPCNKSLMDL